MDPDEVQALLDRARARRNQTKIEIAKLGTTCTRSPLKTLSSVAAAKNISDSKQESSSNSFSQKRFSPHKANYNEQNPNSKQSSSSKFVANKQFVKHDEDLENGSITKTTVTEVEETYKTSEVTKFTEVTYNKNEGSKKVEEILQNMPSNVNKHSRSPLGKQRIWSPVKNFDLDREELSSKEIRTKKLATLTADINRREAADLDQGNTTVHHRRKAEMDSRCFPVKKNVYGSPLKRTQVSNVTASPPTSRIIDVDACQEASSHDGLMSSLKAQGFKESQSGSKLVYDYKLSPKSSPARIKPSPRRCNATDKQPMAGEMTDTASRKSMLEKRNMFESHFSPIKEGTEVDPAFLPLKDRAAIFDKQTPILRPIARFGDAVTPSMLAKKASSNFTPYNQPVSRCRSSSPNKKQDTSQTPKFVNQGLHRKLFDDVRFSDSKQLPRDCRLNEIAQNIERKKEKNMKICDRFSGGVDVIDDSKDESYVSPVRKRSLDPPENVDLDVTYPGINSIKRIKATSPLKPGGLYPDLDDIYEAPEVDRPPTAMSEVPSLGTAIRNTASHRQDDELESLKSHSCQKSPLKEVIFRESSQSSLSNGSSAIDDVLDEALLNSSPDDSFIDGRKARPQKHGLIENNFTTCEEQQKTVHNKNILSPTLSSSSWEYQKDSLIVDDFESHRPDYKTPLVSEIAVSPPRSFTSQLHGRNLLHSISFYRQEQAGAVTSTQPLEPEGDYDKNVSTNQAHDNTAAAYKSAELDRIKAEIHKLQDEARDQETRMAQSSKAVKCCINKDEFEGSTERVEAERLLLEATHKYSALMAEIQKLKTLETSIWSNNGQQTVVSSIDKVRDCKGSISLSGIRLPLKPAFLDLLRNGGDGQVHYFMCLIKCRAQVIATQMVSSAPIDGKYGISHGSLHFPNLINLRELDFDFSISLEVYGLQSRREIKSHEEKYLLRKEKSVFNLTPLKKLTSKHHNISNGKGGMPNRYANPVNNNTIRRPSFGMVGYTNININSVKQLNRDLMGVPHESPLLGHIDVKLTVSCENSIHHRGFLTVFTDMKGFGDWRRRWCRLSESRMYFWLYPEDEERSDPLEVIELVQCVTPTVELVSRDICARMHTIMLERERPTLSDRDCDSLVMRINPTKGITRIRHLLSADMRSDRILWARQINLALKNLRMWDPFCAKPVEQFDDTDSCFNDNLSIASASTGTFTSSVTTNQEDYSTSTDIW